MYSDCWKRILGLCLLFFFSSCSIKEERTDCPCYLTLDFVFVDDVLPQSWPGGLKWNVQTVEGDLIDEGFLDAGELPSGGQVVSVPKTDVLSIAWCVDGGICSPLRGLAIPEGEQSPRIFFHFSELDARCHMLRDTVILHKQYANIDIHLRDIVSADVKYELEGRSSGYERDGSVRTGTFRARLAPDSRGACRIRVPRQADENLRLNIYESGVLARVFNVGETIRSGGYDWSAPDLEDIVLEVDYAAGTVRYSLSQWPETLEFSIVF